MKYLKLKLVLAGLILMASGTYLIAGYQSTAQTLTVFDTGTQWVIRGVPRHTMNSSNPFELMGCTITRYPQSGGGFQSLTCNFFDTSNTNFYGHSYDSTINKAIYAFRPDDYIQVIINKSNHEIVAFNIARHSYLLP